MSFTYGNNPGGSNRDAVRFLLRDTTETGHLLSDEEITWLLAQRSNVYFAAAMGASTIVAKYGAEVDRTIGDLRIAGGGEKVTNYRNLAAELRRLGATGAVPYTGGISKSDKNTADADTDWSRGSFQVGMHDQPGTVTITDSTL
jgi:hypothetical protein